MKAHDTQYQIITWNLSYTACQLSVVGTSLPL